MNMIEDILIPNPPVKRSFDLVFSFLSLLLLFPVILIIFLSAKLESLFNREARGKFFYSETRISQGRPFKLYKIRIFKQKAIDEVLEKDGIVHTKLLEQDKANVTKVGWLAKKFYLDELPQLYSILKGEMSLVGPRPWNPVDYRNEVAKGVYRKKVIKAGLLGLVQISKGGNGEHQNGIVLDEEYINCVKTFPPTKLLFYDLAIIGRSVKLILKGEGL